MSSAADRPNWTHEDNAMMEFIAFPSLLKATPSEEGGERFIYFEASNEALDQQGEVVLAKALEASADYYRQYGNVDLEHYTQIGARAGIANPHLYEIGRPVEVKIREPRTFVKAQIFRGEGEVAEKANHVWQSLTAISPPQRWYPSVGGAVLEKSQEVDGKTGDKRTVIRRVRWTNVGLSKTPVNQAVPTVSTVPVGTFSKALGAFVVDDERGARMAAFRRANGLLEKALELHRQRRVSMYDVIRLEGIRNRLAAGL
jgi:hypothetical protein